MADLSRNEVRRMAVVGARARLEELQREEAAIRRAFPELGGGRAGRAGRAPRGRRRRMSAAARKAISVRMKRYWAERRKGKKSSS